MRMDAPTPPQAKPCPICGKKAAAAHRPFCSARCRMIDLGRWLGGDYRIADAAPPEDGADEPP
jgi:uncharacterized protein